MRPTRIELEGFSAFRDRTVVDLDGVDLFALVGPTGSGKSSVIDAMVFALYGAVPRYDDTRLVAPVITQGAVEAKVRLDFDLDGVAHTAVRVVRRTKTGASTKEARLERGDTVLADDAKAMSAAVVDLLGLDLSQFTRCVVLPQGAFAALLHDSAAHRQDLLVRLLDLGRYAEMGRRARTIARDAETKIRGLDEQLARWTATDADVTAAETRIDALDEVLDAVDAARPRLDDAATELRDAERTAAERRREVETLGDVTAPDDLSAVLGAIAAATDALAAAEAAEQTARDEWVAAEERLAGLAPRDELTRALDQLERIAELETRVERGRGIVADKRAVVAPLAEAAADAHDAVASTAAALEAARLADRAAAVAAEVAVGDDCPVCGHTITELHHAEGGQVSAAKTAHDAAVAAERDATATHQRAANEATRLADTLAEREKELAEARDRLGDAVDADDVRRRLTAHDETSAAVDAARTKANAARGELDRCRSRLDAARSAAGGARTRFQATRDQLARYEPPPTTDDLEADWTALVEWAATRATVAAEELRAAEGDVTEARAERRRLHDELAQAAARVDVQHDDPERLRDAVVAARADTAARAETMRTELAERRAVTERRDELDVERAVHEELAGHLGARRFEAWLLGEALDVLLDGASIWLEALSSGRYALDVDDNHTFVVVDHANAGERRLARTLSGGETFLASLALALALAERITELSATGGRRLEAIFLDEGFGTLDADTLDVVATAIEELGATGRTVGVISHVPELAERVPVRFEVTKGVTTSSVERVER